MAETKSLTSVAKDLEESFFAQEERKLIEKLKAAKRTKEVKEALAEVSGIRDEKVLQKLVELNIQPDTLAALAIVPLVEVAWADGGVDEREREAVLKAAEAQEIRKGDLEYQLLESWLSHRPEPRMLKAWVHYIEGLCTALSKEERASLKKELLENARSIAEASGGFLGLGSKVSKSEAEMLSTLERAFGS